MRPNHLRPSCANFVWRCVSDDRYKRELTIRISGEMTVFSEANYKYASLVRRDDDSIFLVLGTKRHNENWSVLRLDTSKNSKGSAYVLKFKGDAIPLTERESTIAGRFAVRNVSLSVASGVITPLHITIPSLLSQKNLKLVKTRVDLGGNRANLGGKSAADPPTKLAQTFVSTPTSAEIEKPTRSFVGGLEKPMQPLTSNIPTHPPVSTTTVSIENNSLQDLRAALDLVNEAASVNGVILRIEGNKVKATIEL